MRRYILSAFAVATVAILAGAAMAEGPGGPLRPAPIHGPAVVQPAKPSLRAPYGGPSPEADIQAQVFGDLVDAGPLQTLPRFPGVQGLSNREVGR